MSQSGVILTVLFSLLVAAESQLINLEVKLQNDPQCKFRGNQCSSDMRQIIYCSAKNGNSYVVTNCGEARRCGKNATTGEYECMKSGGGVPPPESGRRNNTAFTCHGSGAFPDGYECHVAYLCSSEGKYPDEVCECPLGTALTFYPQWSCTTDEAVLEGCGCPYNDRCSKSWNPNDFGIGCHLGYFYTCRVDSNGDATTEVMKCPDGQYFFEGRCQALRSSASTTSGPVSQSPKPVCRKYEPPCVGGESNVKCSVRGELLPHSIDRCYYFCDGNLRPIVRDCGTGSYFTCKNGVCGCVRRPYRE